MANDRMFIKCNKCNDEVMIAKLWSNGWTTSDEWGQNMVEKINSFFDKHNLCDDNNFTLTYENIEKENIIEDEIEFLSMLIVQYGDILGEALCVLIDHQINKLKKEQ